MSTSTEIYAHPGWDIVDEPELADRWMYQTGDRWMAVAPGELESDWFADTDSDQIWTPRDRVLPIGQRPDYGTLIYVRKIDEDAYDVVEELAVSDEHPPSDHPHPSIRVVTTIEVMVTPLEDESAEHAALRVAERLHAEGHRASASLAAAGPIVQIAPEDVHTFVAEVTDQAREITAW